MTKRTAFLRRIALACSALFALTILASSTSAGAQGSISVSVNSFNETADYASENFGDPWDFSNAEDLPLVPGLNYINTTNESISGGTLQFDTAGQGMAFLTKSWEPSGVSWGRDGFDYPIDADRFSHVSIRMLNSNVDPIASAVYWFDCGQLLSECQGGSRFRIDPGWNTYVIPLVNDLSPSLTTDWAGDIAGFSIVLSSAPGSVDVDWIRLYEPATDPVVDTGTVSNSADVYWDGDTNLANNTPSNRNWGVVGRTTDGKVTFPASAYPPGNYRFYTDSNTTYSAPLEINERPRPIVIDPDIEGGADYAATVRGDAWDMNQSSDIAFTANVANGSFAGGVYTANSTNDDSQITFPVPAARIDPNRWHRFVADVYFAGNFSLKAEPDGGMNGRIIWRLGNGNYRVTDDLVVEPGWNHIVVDLAELDGSDIEGSYADTWTTGGMPDQFRFDPTEDPAARLFKIDQIRLNEDDKGDGEFSIRFEDDAWEAGTTAKIYADTNNSGYNGTLIGDVTMTAGVNTFNWIPAVTGTRWIHIEVTDPDGATASSYSTGPVQVTAAPPSVCDGMVATHVGTPGDDNMYGTPGDDVMFGLGGNDSIRGLAGNDIICGGPGNDRVYGGSGDNVLYGEQGIDKMRAGIDSDILWGGDDRDFLKGGHGDDIIYGEGGSDRLRGSVGNDDVRGGNDNDVMWGGPGDDVLRGAAGNDILKGSAGTDVCYGGPGADTAHETCDTQNGFP